MSLSPPHHTKAKSLYFKIIKTADDGRVGDDPRDISSPLIGPSISILYWLLMSPYCILTLFYIELLSHIIVYWPLISHYSILTLLYIANLILVYIDFILYWNLISHYCILTANLTLLYIDFISYWPLCFRICSWQPKKFFLYPGANNIVWMKESRVALWFIASVDSKNFPAI